MWNWYLESIAYTGRSAALWMLLGFLVTYAGTRAITVRIKRRKASGAADESGALKDVHIGGVHVHDQVWGILLVLFVGLLTFRFSPGSPWIEVLGALVGVGAALALDEFALWLHLEDVYWSEEGKKSIDAVMIAAVFGLVLLVGTSPLGVDSEQATAAGVWVTAAAVLAHVGICVVCLLKGKLVVGLAELPLPTVSFLGAVRLASRSRSGRNAYTERRGWRGRVGGTCSTRPGASPCATASSAADVGRHAHRVTHAAGPGGCNGYTVPDPLQQDDCRAAQPHTHRAGPYFPRTSPCESSPRP